VSAHPHPGKQRNARWLCVGNRLISRAPDATMNGTPTETAIDAETIETLRRELQFRERDLAEARARLEKIEGANGRGEVLNAPWWLSSSAREAHFRSIADGIPELISLVTPVGEVETANRHFLEYFGAPLEELKGRKMTDTLHPDDIPDFLGAWKRSSETGQPYEIEGRRRRADGVSRWFHMHGFPLRDMEERIAYWFLLERDFDDRKWHEALLAGEKRMLEMVALGDPLPAVLDALCRLVEEIAAGCYCSVFLIDPRGPRLAPGAAPSLPESFNAAIWGRPVSLDSGPCGMAAYLNEQVIAADVFVETRWQVDSWCALALEHGLRACWSTPIASRAGTVLGTFALLYDQPGTPTALDRSLIERFTHIAGIAIQRAQEDVALSQMQSELARVSRLRTLGELAASIAHEVNQPLTAVVNNANACLGLLPGSASFQDVRSALAEIVEDADRASAVIAWLRQSVSKTPCARTRLDLRDVVADVASLVRHESAAHHVIIRIDLDEDILSVMGDRVELQQVLLNLVVNGMDAMSTVEESTRVLILSGRSKMRDGQSGCLLRVQDAGIGFSLDGMDRLFEAFYTTKPQGMGMGLAISRSIVEAHGGRLWAEPNQAAGATFLIHLPTAVRATA